MPQSRRIIYAAASAAGSSTPDSDLNPYEVVWAHIQFALENVKSHMTEPFNIHLGLLVYHWMSYYLKNCSQVLGVSPIEGFDMIKAAYTRKRKEAERKGDEATAARVGYSLSLSLSLSLSPSPSFPSYLVNSHSLCNFLKIRGIYGL